MLNQVTDALETFEQALNLDTMDSLAYNAKTLALGSLGRHKEALAAIDQAILLQPTDEGMYLNKANILRGINRQDEAQYYSQNAIKLAEGRKK